MIRRYQRDHLPVNSKDLVLFDLAKIQAIPVEKLEGLAELAKKLL